jgi:hypothetical protein
MLGILNNVDGNPGFHIGLSFNQIELEMIRERIRDAWLENIFRVSPQSVQTFQELEMTDYHTKAHLLDHEHVWPKKVRILDSNFVRQLRQTGLFISLEEEFGEVIISGEDGICPEEVYWRLVRPNSPKDVGPLHADEWFWRLGNWYTPKGYRRLKIWISIFSEKGKNGFKYVSGSHKKEWNFNGEEKSGLLKPVIQENEERLGAVFFEAKPGDAIIFHDKLLHGGSIGGEKTRVSMEWTMFVKE